MGAGRGIVVVAVPLPIVAGERVVQGRQEGDVTKHYGVVSCCGSALPRSFFEECLEGRKMNGFTENWNRGSF